MAEICQSEKKRLASLKYKKQIFKAKELAVQNALKNLDDKTNKNKIIFDDDFGNIVESKQKEKKRKHDLFDDNDDNDDKNDNTPIWDDKKFEIKNKTKFHRQNITLGNDDRFKLDDRFIENDCELDKNVFTENNSETDLQKEKELQLDILGNILGMPVISKNKDLNKDSKFGRKGMVRYDPTQNDHKEFEITVKTPEVDAKKTKKKRKSKENVEDTIATTPLEVSKDVYFSVSDSLSKSLKGGGEFSLLKTYGRVETDRKENDSNTAPNAEPLQTPKFQFGFPSKNPFKYDSSDDEHDNNEKNISSEQHTNYEIGDTNKLFFDINDIRFNEAHNFFSKGAAPENTFKELRRELKQIVRAKIRRNLKKKQPWGYKKKVKKSVVHRK